MTIVNNPRPAGLHADPDVLFVGRGLLLADRAAPDGRPLPSVVLSRTTGGRGAVPTELRLDPRDDPDGDPVAALLATLVPGDLPTLDAWIVDLSLRHERVTVVSPTDVLCSAPLEVVPPGWTAEVAATGMLAVVVLPGPDGPATGPIPVPRRAMRDGASVAARIPVCLSE